MAIEEMFGRGGPLMWPLAALGLAALAVAVDRLAHFAAAYFPASLLERMLETLRLSGATGTAAELPEEPPAERIGLWDRILPGRGFRFKAAPAVVLARDYLANAMAPREAREALLKRRGDALLASMDRRLTALSVIAAASPLIGLLGTIGGMMEAFQEIAASGGQAEIDRLADGLWVAMITTAFGLSVAIPAQAAHGLFQSLLTRRLREMNAVLRLLDERFARESGAIGGDVPAQPADAPAVAGGAQTSEDRSGRIA